jgi:hypothetical protein
MQKHEQEEDDEPMVRHKKNFILRQPNNLH